MTTRERRKREHPASRRRRVLSDLDELESLQADSPDSSRGSAIRVDGSGDEVQSKGVIWNAGEEFQIFRGLACTITARLDLRRVVRTILDKAIQVLGAERGILFLGRQDAVGLVPILAVNLQGQELLAVEKVSRTILAQSGGGRSIITHDATADARFAGVPSVQLNEMRSVLCAPLVSQSGQVGALYLDAPSPNVFSDRMLPLVEAIASLGAVALENAQVHGELVRENARLKKWDTSVQPFDRILGSSIVMESLRRQASAAAMMDQPILIIGEPGSGRRLLARAIHDGGRRSREAFIACDCSEVSGLVLQGVLLGRQGVAARGAYAGEPGLVRLADRGTLYLTEGSALDEDLANGMARIVHRGMFRPMGGRRDERVDLHLIISVRPDPETRTGRQPLPKLLDQKLREVQLNVPALREHPEDIPILVAHFVRSFGDVWKHREGIRFTPEAFHLLQQQPWPGNIRQLRQVIHRILLFPTRPTIGAEEAREALASVGDTMTASAGPWSAKVRPLREWEEEAIRQALVHTRGNRSGAARLLGIHRNTLILKLRTMKLETNA